MGLNGVNTNYTDFEAAKTTQNAVNAMKDAANNEKTATATSGAKVNTDYNEPSATYEHSTATSPITKKNAAIVAQMKADTQQRISQMQSLVTQLFEKQGITIGTADDMWKLLAKGDFTADADTIAQAKKDIAEDGYWGVNQTSERIFSFAKALSGEDDAKMQEMVKAFEKGFKEATKTWGKDLPEISSQTRQAVLDKFDKWFKDNGSTATTDDLLNASSLDTSK